MESMGWSHGQMVQVLVLLLTLWPTGEIVVSSDHCKRNQFAQINHLQILAIFVIQLSQVTFFVNRELGTDLAWLRWARRGSQPFDI